MSYLLQTRKQRTPQWNRQRRHNATPSGVCVIHTAEGNGASNVLNWILTRPDYGSYHRLVDGTSTLKLAHWSAETFHCRFTNPHSVGISAAVFAKDWKKLGVTGRTIIDRMAIEAADFVRYMAGRGVTVPIKRISRADALAKRPGFLAHGDTDPGRRTDPGKDFDWAYFFERVNHHLGNPDSAPGPDTSSKNYYTGVIDGDPGPWTYTAMQRFLADRSFYERAIDGDAGTYTWTALQEFLADLGYFGPAPSGVQDMTTARALQRWLTNTGHYDGPISATWTVALWKAWQTYLSYAHAKTRTYPLKTTATKPKEGFLMALTDRQQGQVHTQVMNISAATKRNEARASDQLEISTQNNELLAELIEILTDRGHSSKLLDKVFKTNAAVGRAEKARKEAEAASAAEQAETDEEENSHV